MAKDFRSSDQARDHDLWDGERMISKAVQQFALKSGLREEFTALPRGDLRRVAVAWAVYRRTSLRLCRLGSILFAGIATMVVCVRPWMVTCGNALGCGGMAKRICLAVQLLLVANVTWVAML